MVGQVWRGWAVTAAHEPCAEALQHPNVAAFLRVIREGESCQEPDAYWWLFGSTRKAPKLAESLSGHPRVKTFERYDGQFIKNGKLDYTTAAGAYQITASTWDTVVQPALQLPDFSPASQDLAAVLLIRKRGALPAVLAGQFAAACALLRNEWASMPGAQHGDQPTQSAQRALDVYLRYGGRMEGAQPEQGPPPEPDPALAPDPAPITPAAPAPAAFPTEWDMQQQPPEPTMAPFIAAALPAIIEAIPKLGRVFGSGSAVAERNLKAAELVAETVKAATGAATEQEAVQRLQADPAAVQAAARAIDGIWYQLTEAGGGGIDGARKADAAAQSTGDIRKSASFWIALLLLPLVYMLVASLIGLLGTATWSDDVRAGLAGSLISAIIGGLVGYYYGTTTSRNRGPGG